MIPKPGISQYTEAKVSVATEALLVKLKLDMELWPGASHAMIGGLASTIPVSDMIGGKSAIFILQGG